MSDRRHTGAWISAAAVLASCLGAALAQGAEATYRFDIPAEPLAKALTDFSQACSQQLILAENLVRNKESIGLHGRYTAAEALQLLLAGTDLIAEANPSGVLMVRPKNVLALAQGAAPTEKQQQGSTEETQGRSFWDRSRLSAAIAGAEAEPVRNSAGDSSLNKESTKESSVLEEVIVTAQKREERLQDVPVAITVLNPQSLTENGQNRLVDYFASVPGLSLSSNASGGGTTYVTIRGLSAGAGQNPIVSTVIDDVPMMASIARGFGDSTAPDLDPSDLARIEVLKGPQGTLYGAASLGGLIKYVTIDPSTERWSGRVEVAGADVPGGGLGYAVRAAVNIPVSEVFALRISGFDRQDPSYIDDLTTGQKNFNSSQSYGGHIAALWRPADDFSVKLGALIQETHGDVSYFNSDISGQSTTPGNRLGLTSLPHTTAYSTLDELYSATVNWKVAGLDIVSVTGYAINSLKNSTDYTALLGSFAYSCQHEQSPQTCALPPDAPAGMDGVASPTDISTHKVTEELRIGSTIGRWLDWRLGGFYTHESAPTWISNIDGTDLSTGTIQFVQYGDEDTTETFREFAVFGDFTAHVTDRLDVGFGGRESWNKQVDQYVNYGLAVNPILGSPPDTPVPFVSQPFEASGSAFTYQVSPKFKISPDLMAYARVATGYRIGGYNVNAFAAINQFYDLPKVYAPDKTTNYELGLKGDFLDHKLSFDASAYYINWKNFQTTVQFVHLTDTGQAEFVQYTANAGHAKSEGVELSIEARPLQGLTIAAHGSYNNAVLAQDLPQPTYGLKGDKLPYSMRWSGGVTANQDIRLAGDWIGFLGGSFNYIDSRPYEFTFGATQPRIFYPSYTQLNLRTGARYDSLLINLYVNNVTDKRGIIGIAPSYSLGNSEGYNATVIQPRTVGLNVSRAF